MKISKTASGKQIVKMSQQEWAGLGKQAGWLDDNGDLVEDSVQKEAQAAPAAPPKTRPDKTTTPDKNPTQKPTRRKFPNPGVNPKPKGQDEEQIAAETEEEVVEASTEEEIAPDRLPTIASELAKLKKKVSKTSGNFYQRMVVASFGDNAHRSVSGFWENIPEGHPLGKNQFLRENGKRLAEANYNYLTERHPPETTSMVQIFQDIQNILTQVQMAERGHEEELGALAKSLISEEWGIDEDMLETNFMEEEGGSGEPPDHEVGEEVPITPQLQEEINKRTILNTLSQGAGLHAMLSMHHLAADRLGEISPQLLGLYDKFSNLITQHYFYLDMAVIERMADKVAEAGTGWAETEYPDEENGAEKPKVKAQAMNFPIMLQELVKGIVGMATDHGLDNESRKDEDLSMEEKMAIMNISDRLVDEPYLIMVGPELWRQYLQVQPEGANKFDVLSELSASQTGNVTNVVSNVVNSPDEARTDFQSISDTLDEFETVSGPQTSDLDLPEIDSPDLGEVDLEEDDLSRLNNELADLGLGDAPTTPYGPADHGQGRVQLDDDEDDDDDEDFSWLLG